MRKNEGASRIKSSQQMRQQKQTNKQKGMSDPTIHKELDSAHDINKT